MSRLIARGIALWTVLVACSSAFALNPSLDVNQYAHTAWRIRDGFIKATPHAIAQTVDGYIWIGTDAGIFRFDGVSVTAWQPPPGQALPSAIVNNLVVARDGTLWISTTAGLASWNRETLSQYPAFDGRYVGKVLEDHDGTVWVTAANQRTARWTLGMMAGGQTQLYGDDGGPGAGAVGLFEDSGNRLWVGTYDGLWRWKPGPSRWFPIGPQPNGVQGIVEDDKTLLLSVAGGVRRFADGRTELAYPLPPPVQPAQASQLLRDRDGGLWLGTPSSGLVHVHRGRIDVFTGSDGLSGERVSKLFEDREGSVWVVTPDGVDRFRNPAVSTFSVRQGLSSPTVTSVAACDGVIWLGTFAGVSSRRDTETRLRIVPGLLGAIQSIFCDHRHRLWATSSLGAGILEPGRFVAVRGRPQGNVRAIAEDSRGVWLAIDEVGLVRVSSDAQRIEEEIPWRTLKQQDRGTAITADARRTGVWVGFAGGGIAYVSDAAIGSSYAASDGLGAGVVHHLRLDSDGSLWVSTDGGLSHVRNGRVSTVSSRNGLPCDGVRWALEDDTRSLWVHTMCGLVRLSRSEIDRWVSAAEAGKTPGRLTFTALLDTADGVRDAGIGSFTSPAVVATDGRLWFKSTVGISMLDPHHLPFNAVPPPVRIERIIADHTTYDTGGSLPALVRDVQVDYTALSFVAPEKVRFRYVLEGFDRDWQDVGNRRQAFYTNLPPRDYRFRVQAANDSGVWNETGASLAFSIAPAYYQTAWFLALATAMAVALVWGAHRLRVGIVERHERQITALNERLMKAQEQERMRIAGELHDGVMQEMLAVTMMLGTAKRRIPDESAAKGTIEKIQDKMLRLGTDIRRLSHDLHPPVLQEAGLPQALQICCEEFSGATGITVCCDADERARDLSRGAALALFRIVQEALGNAAKHAKATKVSVGLTRSDGMVSLSVSDNGVGFDGGRLAGSGGLGMVMMRERASQLNGTFEFDSAPGRGTTIRIAIPFR